MSARPSSRGFTLLEVCVVLFLTILIVAMAVPSLVGQMARQRLQDAYDHFDSLVVQAREHSMTDNKAYLLAWQKGAVCLYPADWDEKMRRKSGPVSSLAVSAAAGEHYDLLRQASLNSNPAAEWIFWPSGNCEPVTVRFGGKAGTWEASYNPLSGRGSLDRFTTQ